MTSQGGLSDVPGDPAFLHPLEQGIQTPAQILVINIAGCINIPDDEGLKSAVVVYKLGVCKGSVVDLIPLVILEQRGVSFNIPFPRSISYVGSGILTQNGVMEAR